MLTVVSGSLDEREGGGGGERGKRLLCKENKYGRTLMNLRSMI